MSEKTQRRPLLNKGLPLSPPRGTTNRHLRPLAPRGSDDVVGPPIGSSYLPAPSSDQVWESHASARMGRLATASQKTDIPKTIVKPTKALVCKDEHH
uniref:SFRICE_027420 n=1 Tax=Spodoptera frugiperda TaxID=7108 RepID=A0A2H1V7Y6_SPOFR